MTKKVKTLWLTLFTTVAILATTMFSLTAKTGFAAANEPIERTALTKPDEYVEYTVDGDFTEFDAYAPTYDSNTSALKPASCYLRTSSGNNHGMVYLDGRFSTPSIADAKIVLAWTAPSNGTFDATTAVLRLNPNGGKGANANADGIRFFVAVTDNLTAMTSFKLLTKELWNENGYEASTETKISFVDCLKNISLTEGQSIVIVADPGAARKNALDLFSFNYTFDFTVTGGQKTTYNFGSSYIYLKYQTLAEEKDKITGDALSSVAQSMDNFSFGKLELKNIAVKKNEPEAPVTPGEDGGEGETQNKVEFSAPSTEASIFAQGVFTEYDGYHAEAAGQTKYGSYYIHDKENTTKNGLVYLNNRFTPGTIKDSSTALVWTAPSDGTLNVTNAKILLNPDGGKGANASADGIRVAIAVTDKYTTSNSLKVLSESFWNNIPYTANEETAVSVTDYLNELELKKNQSLAIIVNAGKDRKNAMDIVRIQLEFGFGDKTYAFGEGEIIAKFQSVAKEEDKLTGSYADKATNCSEGFSFCYFTLEKLIESSYDDVEIGETVANTYPKLGAITEEEMYYEDSNKKYDGFDGTSIDISTAGEGHVVVTVSDSVAAFKLEIKQSGRVQIDDDSFIKLLQEGNSDGIRFRILRNQDVIYPTNGSWVCTKSDKAVKLTDVPVFDVTEGDVIYFAFDKYCNVTEDNVQTDLVVHFAKTGETYTDTYRLVLGASGVQGENGWSYVKLSIASDDYDNIITVPLKNGGCSADASEAVVPAAIAMTAIMFIIITVRRRRKDEKNN